MGIYRLPVCVLYDIGNLNINLFEQYNYFAFIITDKATISWCCWTPGTPPWLHASAAEPGAECSPSTLSAGEAAATACGAANKYFTFLLSCFLELLVRQYASYLLEQRGEALYLLVQCDALLGPQPPVLLQHPGHALDLTIRAQ